MNIDYSILQAFSMQFTDEEPPILAELNRATHANVPMARMISGRSLGRFLAFISKIMQPKRILEIGTFTGYSAICLAEGLPSGGLLHTIDKNKKLVPFVQEYLTKAGIEKKVQCHVGEALEVLPQLKETFDLVFIDADKANYSNYYQKVLPLVRKGGVILADNMYLNGKVLHADVKEKPTQGIQDFLNLVHQDPLVDHICLPLRDGLMLIRKK